MAKILLGGGCFWCVEAVMNEISGITATSGYAMGSLANPTYKEVCSGQTGHNEVVLVEYDEEVISLQEILKVFWTTHNPTTLNRQGNDVGTQYRSGIYYYHPDQLAIIEQSIESVAKVLWDDPIVTEVLPAQEFFEAEDYHQDYYEQNPNQGYCAYIIAPKISKFRKTFDHLRKKDNG